MVYEPGCRFRYLVLCRRFIHIKVLATSTCEILLMQMTVRFFIQRSAIDVIQNKLMAYACWLLLFWFLSVGGGVMMNRLFFSRYNIKSRTNG